MTAFEAIYGIAEEDRHYGYFAVRPPLTSEQLAMCAENTNQYNMQGMGYVMRAQMDDTVTEIEFWCPKELTSETMTEKLAPRLEIAVRLTKGTIRFLSGEVSVQGAEPLFQQYAEQHLSTSATQNS